MAVLRRRLGEATQPGTELDLPEWFALGGQFLGGFYEGSAQIATLLQPTQLSPGFEDFSLDLLERLGPASWGVTGWGAAVDPQIAAFYTGQLHGRGGFGRGRSPWGRRGGLSTVSWLLPERSMPVEAPAPVARRRSWRLGSSPAQRTANRPTRRASVVPGSATPLRGAPAPRNLVTQPKDLRPETRPQAQVAGPVSEELLAEEILAASAPELVAEAPALEASPTASAPEMAPPVEAAPLPKAASSQQDAPAPSAEAVASRV